jgi:hypothetical protein
MYLSHVRLSCSILIQLVENFALKQDAASAAAVSFYLAPAKGRNMPKRPFSITRSSIS